MLRDDERSERGGTMAEQAMVKHLTPWHRSRHTAWNAKDIVRSQ
jgi:hypothetical protein